MDYFPHDTNAINDDKLLALRVNFGGEAVFCYWTILEKIYGDEKPFPFGHSNPVTTSLLCRINVVYDRFEEYVNYMVEVGLFDVVEVENNVKDGNETCKALMSQRALEFIAGLDKKRETARQNAKARKSQTIGSQSSHDLVTTSSRGSEQHKTIKHKTIKKDKPIGLSKEKRPTADEVRSYAAEYGYPSFEAERFIDYYEANGWKVGRNPMKDWKATVRNWCRKDNPKGGESVDYSKFDICR